MSLPSNTVLRRAPESAWRKIDGQVAIISLDVNRIRLLNDVGSFVWERCDGLSLETLVTAMCEVYAVDRERAERDVQTFVAELMSRGMITVSSGER